MVREIKYFIQRGRRGYSDRDMWCFDNYLATIIPPVVRHYKGSTTCPPDLYDKGHKNEYHKWDEVLEEIAQGFEVAKRECNTLESEEEDLIKFRRAMDLLKKHFFSLWD